jgi:Na+/proline symporter
LKDPDGVLLRLLEKYAAPWLAGLLGAGIISAVMGSDAHQVLAMSTMFTKDIYAHYGGHKKYGERSAVHFARGFIVVVTVIAYVVALYLKEKQGIFEIAIRFAFSGFAAMAPVMVAALFWKRSTRWGALASTVFVASTLVIFGLLQGPPTPPPGAAKPGAAKLAGGLGTNKVSASKALAATNAVAEGKSSPDGARLTNSVSTNVDKTADIAAPSTNAVAKAPSTNAPPKLAAGPAVAPKNIIWQIGEGTNTTVILSRAPTGDVRFLNGFMTVVPMVIGSALCMIVFSLLTRPPSQPTIDKYFSKKAAAK